MTTFSLGLAVTSACVTNQGTGGDPYAVGGVSPGSVFDFVNEYYKVGETTPAFGDVFTFSRTGTATYRDSNGVLQTAATGVPRIGAYFWDGDSWVDGGIQIERLAATNLITDSDDLSGWTASNMTVAKNQTGADGNANSAHSLTATANDATVLLTVTSASNPHVFSALVKRLTGTGKVWMTVNGGTSWVDVTNQINSTQFLQIHTVPNTTVTDPEVGFKLSTSGDAIAVQVCQLEQTARRPSSSIPTSGGTATRNAERLYFSGASLPYNDTSFSIQVNGAIEATPDTGDLRYLFGGYEDASDFISVAIRMDGSAYEGSPQGSVATTGETTVAIPKDNTSPLNGCLNARGVAVPFSIAFRISTTADEANWAQHGLAPSDAVAYTPAALPTIGDDPWDLLGRSTAGTANGFVQRVRAWGSDIGDTGIEEASQPTVDVDADILVSAFSPDANSNTQRMPGLCILSSTEALQFFAQRHSSITSAADGNGQRLVMQRLTFNPTTGVLSKSGSLMVIAEPEDWADGLGFNGHPHAIKVSYGPNAGRVVLLYNQNDVPSGQVVDRSGYYHIYMRYSDDDGATWSAPVKVVDCNNVGGGDYDLVAPGSNGDVVEIQSGVHQGRLIVPCFVYGPQRSGVIYSDDYGMTWTSAGWVDDVTEGAGFPSETTLTAFSDNTLYMTIRCEGDFDRWYATSTDYGATWSQAIRHPVTYVQPCNASSLNIGDDVILLAQPTAGSRQYFRVYKSEDGGVTWPYYYQPFTDWVSCGYNSMKMIDSNRVLWAYETHRDGSFNGFSSQRCRVLDLRTVPWTYAPDVTAPTLSAATDVTTSGSSADIGVTTDEFGGTLYWVVTTSATTPSHAQIKAGQDHTGSAATDSGSQLVPDTGEQSVSVTGLSVGTYYAHFTQEDASGNAATPVSADGFTLDITAPTLSSPTDTANGGDAGTIDVSTNEATGTLYWVVTQSATSPSAAQVQAGQDHTGASASASDSQAVTGTGAQGPIAVTGLAGGTTYYAHFCHVDASLNASTVASADGFTTDAFTPALLFASSEAGVWIEPSPSNCYTDTGRTTNASVGDAVASITDLSGNARHLSQATSGSRPILRQDGGGKYYLEFDGTDDWFTYYTGTIAADKAVYAAFSQDATATRGCWLANDATAFEFLWQEGSAVASTAGGTWTLYDDGVASCSSGASSTRGDVFTAIDGSRYHGFEQTGGTTTSRNWRIGASILNGYRTKGDLYAFIHVDRSLTAGERDSLEAYLDGKAA